MLNAAMHLSLQDSIIFIEQHKSGFERPTDVEFEDYTQGIKAATSDSSLNPPKVRTKLWPFSKKHKVNLHASRKLNRIFDFKGIEQSSNGGDLLHPGRVSLTCKNSSDREQVGSACPEFTGLCSDQKQNIFIKMLLNRLRRFNTNPRPPHVQRSKVNLESKTTPAAEESSNGRVISGL